ncbi:G1 family glutamic endopeptidase, partial [Caldivirga sp.]|uniref:G1 family glutamic endopeptidase n=1 Tax=Caldivirga sp. TaxID=2080243 RepID=UPI003D137CFE
MAGENISSLIPSLILAALLLTLAGVIIVKITGVANTASTFDAQYNTVARILYINQSGYWIITVQYAGGVYQVYGVVLSNGDLIKEPWPMPIHTVNYPLTYRYVRFKVNSPGSNPPTLVLLKVGSSIVGVKVMGEFTITLMNSSQGNTVTVTVTAPGSNGITFIINNDTNGASWSVTDACGDSKSGNSNANWTWYYSSHQTSGGWPPWAPWGGGSCVQNNQVHVTAKVNTPYCIFKSSLLGSGSSISGNVPLGSVV